MSNLHSVGPASPAEDEQQIGKRYTSAYTVASVAGSVVGITMVVGDLKWTMGIGIIALLAVFGLNDARQFDLSVRIRRTNLLLREITERLDRVRS